MKWIVLAAFLATSLPTYAGELKLISEGVGNVRLLIDVQSFSENTWPDTRTLEPTTWLSATFVTNTNGRFSNPYKFLIPAKACTALEGVLAVQDLVGTKYVNSLDTFWWKSGGGKIYDNVGFFLCLLSEAKNKKSKE